MSNEDPNLPPLAERLNLLLQRLDAEALDTPPFEALFRERGDRADYLMFDRSLVVELKDLQDDPEYKIQRVFDKFTRRPGFPIVVFGTASLTQVTQKLPPDVAGEINSAVANAVSEVLEDLVEKANRQIRNTKQVLGLPEAGGLLFISNAALSVLSPALVVYRLERVIKKHTKEGTPRFPEIHAVCYVSEAHVTPDLPDGQVGFAICTFEGPLAPCSARVADDLAYILKRWSAAHGVPLLTQKGSAELLEGFTSLRK